MRNQATASSPTRADAFATVRKSCMADEPVHPRKKPPRASYMVVGKGYAYENPAKSSVQMKRGGA